jgi:hypothetical protein
MGEEVSNYYVDTLNGDDEHAKLDGYKTDEGLRSVKPLKTFAALRRLLEGLTVNVVHQIDDQTVVDDDPFSVGVTTMSEYQQAIDDALAVVESYKYGEYAYVSDDAPEDSMEVLRAKAVESTVEGIMGELRELRKRERSVLAEDTWL